MEYQTFRGADVKEALNAVKAALGPDAMIGSTRFVSNDQSGGLNKSYVEVLAAEPNGSRRYSPFAQGTQSASARRAEERPVTSRVTRALALGGQKQAVKSEPRATALSELEAQASTEAQSRSSIASLEQEISTLKAMLEELHRTRPSKERAQAMLAGIGVEGTLAKELAGGAARAKKKDNQALEAWLKEQIRDRFRTCPGLINGSGKQIVACVGPTGVGKTTTLAKLAAKARLDLGKSVGVITLDTYRVGALEQWQRYADLMGLSAHVAHNPEMFQQALRQNNSDLLLIDTPGHVGKTQNDWPIAQCLAAVAPRRMDVLLVLPAWLTGRDVEQVTRDYDAARPTALTVTKLDEANRKGGVLHGAAARELPFAYLCSGPRVPEDITDATSDALLDAIFER
ncbi:MAG TPA: flagellar biosynthesis protein FlhF [Polyangiaceae bacterium]|jgi:flagellar biosynthesis protein FlhF|nr:flagellar biosynthesis protein FlhF [Polyangiaceae bacterium]